MSVRLPAEPNLRAPRQRGLLPIAMLRILSRPRPDRNNEAIARVQDHHDSSDYLV